MIFDIDPPEDVVEAALPAALLVADTLESVGLTTTPMTTGSKGYHLVAPINPDVSSEDVADWAQLISVIAGLN